MLEMNVTLAKHKDRTGRKWGVWIRGKALLGSVQKPVVKTAEGREWSRVCESYGGGKGTWEGHVACKPWLERWEEQACGWHMKAWVDGGVQRPQQVACVLFCLYSIVNILNSLPSLKSPDFLLLWENQKSWVRKCATSCRHTVHTAGPPCLWPDLLHSLLYLPDPSSHWSERPLIWTWDT